MQSTPWWQQLADQSILSLLAVNSEGQIVYANRQAVNLLGFSQEELINSSILAIKTDLNSAGWNVFKKQARHQVSPPSPQIMVYHRKNRTNLTVEETVNFIKNAPSTLYLITFSEAETTHPPPSLPSDLSQLLSHAPIMIWRVDPQLKFVFLLGDSTKISPDSKHPPGPDSLFDYFKTRDESYLPIAAHLKALSGQSMGLFI